MKIRYLVSGIAIILVIIQGLVFALVPPPPVDQEIGVNDTLFTNYTENMCRGCHTLGINDLHHLNTKYSCKNCHPMNGSQIIIVRDCKKCHNNTFNNMTIRRPHHETQYAQDKHCSLCHGNIIDDFDDGHYIPTYDISFTTPSSKYKIVNSTTGQKFGGCESCHQQNDTYNIYPANSTHHNLGNLSGFSPSNNSKCEICHNYNGQYEFDSIRYCERCHSVKALHNLQHDFLNTTNLSGHGHTGSDWDCDGCHTLWVTGDIKPSVDVIIPFIDKINSSKIYAENTTKLTINGDNFLSVSNLTVVIVSNNSNNITLNPDSITDDQVIVTIPLLKKGRYGIYILKNGKVKSNRRPMVSIPKVMVNSAKKSNSIVTIKGSGFGYYDATYKDWVNVTIKIVKKGVTTFRKAQITAWNDTLITVSSSDSVVGDTATVNSIFGINSTKVNN